MQNLRAWLIANNAPSTRNESEIVDVDGSTKMDGDVDRVWLQRLKLIILFMIDIYIEEDCNQ